MSDEQQVKFTAPADLVEKADRKLEYGERSEVLRQELRRIAYGEKVSEKQRVQEKLRDLREDRRDIDREINDLQNEREEVDRKIDRAESRLNDLAEQDGEYDGVLAMLEEDLNNGIRILSGAPKVERAAEIGDCSRERVVNDLRERNPDAPDMAFRKAEPSEEPNWKDEYTSTEDVHVQLESTCTSRGTNVEGGE